MPDPAPLTSPWPEPPGFDGFLRSLPAACAALRPQTLDVLGVLYRHRDRIVSKRAMSDAVWAGLAVTDDSLVQCVAEIRRALDHHAPVALHTHRGRGYRLAWTGGATLARSGADGLPTVAVPAFTHTDRPGEADVAHALVEDLTGELARRCGFPVVSAGAASRPDARYLVQGGVHSCGARTIVNVRLVDADTHVVVWSRRFAEPAEASFGLQDAVVAATVGAIGGGDGVIARAERGVRAFAAATAVARPDRGAAPGALPNADSSTFVSAS